MKRIRFLIFLVHLFAAHAALAAEPALNQVVTYPITFADVSVIRQAVEQVAGEDADIIYNKISRRLTVVTTADKHRLIAQLMGQLNVAPPNVRIDVTFNERGRTRDRGGRVQADGGIVFDGRGGTGGRIRVKPQVHNVLGETRGVTKQMLLVTSGKQARLRVGEDIPFVNWFMNYGINVGQLEQVIDWRNVGSFLMVEPTVIGNGPTIRVRLTPVLSGLVEDQPFAVAFKRVSTDVVAYDGQPLRIGGSTKHREFYTKFFAGSRSGGESSSVNITMTAHIVKPPKPKQLPPRISDPVVPRRPR